jgi:hypothetical protein
MKTSLLSLFVVAALLQLGLTIYNRHDAKVRHDSEPSATDDTDSARPVAQLNPTLAPRLPLPPSIQPAGVKVDLTPDDPAKYGKAGANKVRTDDDAARELEAAFTTDSPPNATSAKRSAAIVQGFGGPLAKGAHLSGVDCRATRCKLDIELADRSADDHVMSELFTILRSVDVDCDGLGYQVAKREVLPDGTVFATVHLFDAPAAEPVL